MFIKRMKKGKCSCGKPDTGEHVPAAWVSVTSSQVVTIDAHQRSILIGPDGHTLRGLLKAHGVRMSLSRDGQVIVRGKERRVSRAVADIHVLLRQTEPAKVHFVATTYDQAQCHFRQRLDALSEKVHHDVENPPPEHPTVELVRNLWSGRDVLGSFGRRLGAVIWRILDHMRRPHQ